MKRHDASVEAYRKQLNEWVAAMSVADNEAVKGMADGYTVEDVRLFTEGNLDKRADILSLQLEFLRRAFDDLDDLIDEYITTQPQAAFGAGPADAAEMLRWLSDEIDLTEEQLDHIACRQGRYEVEDAARENRRAHLRFQERISVARRLADDLERNADLRVHLNPAIGWAKMQTRALVDASARLPADVVFYAVGEEIRSAVIDDPVPELLEELAEKDGMTLTEWAERAGMECAGDLLALTRRLAEMGVVAFS